MEQKRDLAWLNFHHLRYFWVVAHEGSLRQAAARLHVSPPSISTQLGALEEALGEPLFHREGRRLVLTEFGATVLGYADEIFSLSHELLASRAGDRRTARPRRLSVGIVDSLPKVATMEFLRPALAAAPGLTLACEEGSLPELLGRLAAHHFDVVLADQPAGPHPGARTFDHLLLVDDTTFHAPAGVAAELSGRFPACLDGAPALLPSHRSPLRLELDAWFRRHDLNPRVVGEFADPALAKVAAAEGLGFLPLPSMISEEAIRHFDLRVLGRARDCRSHFYAITAARRVEHAAVAAIISARRVKKTVNRRKSGASTRQP